MILPIICRPLEAQQDDIHQVHYFCSVVLHGLTIGVMDCGALEWWFSEIIVVTMVTPTKQRQMADNRGYETWLTSVWRDIIQLNVNTSLQAVTM